MERENDEERKELYEYQQKDIDTIFEKFEGKPDNYHTNCLQGEEKPLFFLK